MIRYFLSLTWKLRYFISGITYKLFANQESIMQLRNRFQGKPMLVVGNGPSLNKTPLDDFLGIPAIGMNKIDLLYNRVKWRPSIVICVNNLVVKQHWSSFIKSEVPVFLSWKSRLIGKHQYKETVNYFLSLPNQKFSLDLAQGVGTSATVTYSALQFAYFMGANPVILFGVDHSFSFQGQKGQYQERKGKDINHFDPNYFQEGSWWGTPDLEASEIGYLKAKEVFEQDGRRILDATIDGKLEIFPKISLEEAKKLCNIQL